MKIRSTTSAPSPRRRPPRAHAAAPRLDETCADPHGPERARLREDAAEAVRTLWRTLAEGTVPARYLELDLKPHVTIAVFDELRRAPERFKELGLDIEKIETISIPTRREIENIWTMLGVV